MNIKDIISQLNSIKEDAQTRITDDEPDSIWVDDVKAIDEAIKLIEKQREKKPDCEGDGYDDNGNLRHDTWICPSCGAKYEIDYEKYKHCPECGQKIDRSEIDET